MYVNVHELRPERDGVVGLEIEDPFQTNTKISSKLFFSLRSTRTEKLINEKEKERKKIKSNESSEMSELFGGILYKLFEPPLVAAKMIPRNHFQRLKYWTRRGIKAQ